MATLDPIIQPFDADTSGHDRGTRRIRENLDQAAEASRRFQKVFQGSFEGLDREGQKAARGLITLRSTLGGAERAAAQYAQAELRLNQAIRAGLVSTSEAARLRRHMADTFSTAAVKSRDLRTNIRGLREDMRGLIGIARQLSPALAGGLGILVGRGGGGGLGAAGAGYGLGRLMRAGPGIGAAFGALGPVGLGVGGVALGGAAVASAAVPLGLAGERRRLQQLQFEALGQPGARPQVAELGLEFGDLEGAIATFRRLTIANDELGASTEELLAFQRDLFETIRAGGTTTQEASAGIFQLSQALASGRLQGDEFRSIMENLPLVARAISRGLVEMGVASEGTIGELRDLSREGELTSKRIFEAFRIGSRDLVGAVEDMPLPIATNLSRITQSFGEAAAAIGDISGIYDWLSGTVQAAADWAVEMSSTVEQGALATREAVRGIFEAVNLRDTTEELRRDAEEQLARLADQVATARISGQMDLDTSQFDATIARIQETLADLEERRSEIPEIEVEKPRAFEEVEATVLRMADQLKELNRTFDETSRKDVELRGNVMMDRLDTEPTRAAAQAEFDANPLIARIEIEEVPTPDLAESVPTYRIDTIVEPAAAPQVSEPAPVVINQIMGPTPAIDYPETRQINVPVGIDQPREPIRVPDTPEIQLQSVLPDVATMRRAFERLTETLQSYLPDLSIGSDIEDPGRPSLPIVEPLQVEVIRPEIPVPVEPTMPRLRAPVDVDRITPPQTPLLSPLNVPIERPTVPTPVTPELLPLRQDVVTDRAPAPVQPFVDEMEIPVETPRIPAPDLPEDLPTIVVPVETEVAPLPVIPPLPTLKLLTDIPLPSRADVAQWVRNVQVLLEPLRIETETEPAEPPELPAVDELRVPVERPIVPRPDAPTMSPLRVPTTTAPAPAPELPYLPGMDIPVRRPRVPEPQYPTLNRLMVPTDTERAPQPQLPLIPRLQVETDIGAVPDIELPDVPTLIIPVELADIPLPEPPEIEALEVPVERPVIPEPVEPVISPLQVRTETEAAPQPRLPIVRAIEVPTTTQPAPDVELPEVDPLTVEVLTEDAPEPRMPVLDAVRIDTVTEPAPIPDLPPALPVITIETRTDPVLPPALPAMPTLRVRVERPVVPEIELPEIPALLVDVLTEDAPEPRLPELDPLVVPVAQPVAPDVLLPLIPEILVPTRTERAPRPVLPDIEPLVVGASIQPDPVPAPELPEIPDIVVRSRIEPPEAPILPDPDNLMVASVLGLPTLADVERWWADLKAMIPILGVDTETEPAPEPEYPTLDTLVVPVRTEDAPAPEYPDAETIRVQTETEPARNPILPREGVFLKAGFEFPDVSVADALKWWERTTLAWNLRLKPELDLDAMQLEPIELPAQFDLDAVEKQVAQLGPALSGALRASLTELRNAETAFEDLAEAQGLSRDEAVDFAQANSGQLRDVLSIIGEVRRAFIGLAGDIAGIEIPDWERQIRPLEQSLETIREARPAPAQTGFGLGPAFSREGLPDLKPETATELGQRRLQQRRQLYEAQRKFEQSQERTSRRSIRPAVTPEPGIDVDEIRALYPTAPPSPEAVNYSVQVGRIEQLREASELTDALTVSLEDVEQAGHGTGAVLQDAMIGLSVKGEDALDVLNRIGEQLAEIALRTATTGLFDRVLPELVGGAFSNLFSGAPGVAGGGGVTPGPEVSKAPTGETLFYTVKRGGFERGGPVQARQSALVGEKRPELFIPGLTTDQLTPRKLGNQPELVGERGPELVQATQSGTILPLTQIRPDSILFRQTGGSLPATSRALVGEGVSPELFVPHGGGSTRAQATMAAASPVEVKVIDQRSGNPPAITPQVRTGANGQRFVEVLVTDGLSSASRSGRLDPMMGQYGVRRTGVIR